jgi:hypothetical protein
MRGLGTFRPREASQPAPCLAKRRFFVAVDHGSARPCSGLDAEKMPVCPALAAKQAPLAMPTGLLPVGERSRAVSVPATASWLLLPLARPLAGAAIQKLTQLVLMTRQAARAHDPKSPNASSSSRLGLWLLLYARCGSSRGRGCSVDVATASSSSERAPRRRHDCASLQPERQPSAPAGRSPPSHRERAGPQP